MSRPGPGRGAALAVAAAGLAATLVWGAVGRGEAVLDAAARALAEGRPAEVVALLDGGNRRPHPASLLLGTALLETGREAEAVVFLAAASREGPPEGRRAALHNLAVAHLRLASGPPGKEGGVAAHAGAAAEAARGALRLDPDAPGTRWNLALALRLAGEGGAVGEGGTAPTGAAGGMDVAAATRILDAVRAGEGMELGRVPEGTGPSWKATRGGPPW